MKIGLQNLRNKIIKRYFVRNLQTYSRNQKDQKVLTKEILRMTSSYYLGF